MTGRTNFCTFSYCSTALRACLSQSKHRWYGAEAQSVFQTPTEETDSELEVWPVEKAGEVLGGADSQSREGGVGVGVGYSF